MTEFRSKSVCRATILTARCALVLLLALRYAVGAGSVVIAQAGSETLDDGAVRALVRGLSASDHQQLVGDASALERLVRNELVNRSLLSEARAKGFDKQSDTIAQLERLRDDALARLWIASRATVPASYPSETEITAAYESNKAALVSATQLRVAQIYVAAPDGSEPTKLAAALRKAGEIGGRMTGGDFAGLAKDYSEHADSAGKGGDMGYIADSQLAPEVLAAVRGLKPGEVVGPVKSAQGLHFFKLLDRKAGVPLTFAEAHDRLAAALRTRRANEQVQSYLAELRGRLAISVNQIELAKLEASLH